jgi:regulator of replication initiation timing
MYAQAIRHEANETQEGQFGEVELLEVLVALRQEVRTMAGEVKDVVRENEALKAEVHRLRTRQQATRKRTDVEKIRRECNDGLAKLQALAEYAKSAVTPKPTRRARAEELVAAQSAQAEADKKMRKMMLLMLLGDMV